MQGAQRWRWPAGSSPQKVERVTRELAPQRPLRLERGAVPLLETLDSDTKEKEPLGSWSQLEVEGNQEEENKW